MDSLTDLHIHTLVSDGENTTPEILEAAARLGLRRIAITDHDAVGAYRHFGIDPVDKARTLGIQLITGIELDTDYGGVEVHLLGYGIDINHPELNAHLNHVQKQRRQRIQLQAQALNSHFNRQVVDLDAIILAERDTVMKPHLFRFLIRAKLVKNYKAFKDLLEQHARVDVRVDRPRLSEAINLILRAGGKPVLAHPGYLTKTNLDLDTMVKEMAACGLAGLETDYPYWQPRNPRCSRFPDLESQQRMVASVRDLAVRFNLFLPHAALMHTTWTHWSGSILPPRCISSGLPVSIRVYWGYRPEPGTEMVASGNQPRRKADSRVPGYFTRLFTPAF